MSVSFLGIYAVAAEHYTKIIKPLFIFVATVMIGKIVLEKMGW